jgi:AbrB family looped-hinge helix DNA binding protein
MVMGMEMVIKIDKKGRVILPKEVREKYQFTHNTNLILIEQDEGVLLKRKKAKRTLASIFENAPSAIIDKNTVIDVANYDENDS